MLTYHPTILILVVLTDFREVSTAEWTYHGDHGPNNWPGACKTGTHQSPIDILSKSAVKADLGDLKFIRYESAFSGNVTNNGHTILVELSNTDSLPIQLESEYLRSTYRLEQLHFHWDSEHTIDGHRYPLEMHLVHYDERYNNVSTASRFKNAVAVVSTFFEIEQDDNEALQPILKATEQVSVWVGKSTTALRTKLKPFMLIPKERDSYYVYEGSLTTPNCQESVAWFVMTETLPISEDQLRVFHNVSTASGILKSNNRPTQPIGDRKIYHHLSQYSSARSNFFLRTYVLLICTFLLSQS